MLNQPTSSPMMTRMLGRWPDGACCACASVVSTDAAAPNADAAAKLVVASRTLRRLISRAALSFFFSLIIACLSYDASKTNMAGGRIHRFRVARSRAVAAAVVRRAEMRAAFKDLARDFDLRQRRIVAVLLAPAAGILWNAARFRRVGLMFGGPPISGPLPDIADHVVEAVAVRRERRHRRGARVTID